MWVTDMAAANTTAMKQRNGLYKLATCGALLVSLLFCVGAYGHFVAVWWQIVGGDTDLQKRLLLLLPGAVLTGTAALNLLLSRTLWQARSYALNGLLAANFFTLCYLIYLMLSGVPGHPIGSFLVLVTSEVILLLAIRVGLVWPVESAASPQTPKLSPYTLYFVPLL